MNITDKILVWRLEGQRPFGIPRHRWEDIIKIDLREVGCEDVERIHLAHVRISVGLLRIWL